ncbi:MAG: hypothetical protein HY703_08400 [Gemmatimonadetes bacterium]|nr:hypothetical protein [Gemmatimonadota bacterium]
MSEHKGPLEEVRAAIFAAKEASRVAAANASPEEKFAMLEVMQELADALREARATLRPSASRSDKTPGS